MLIKELIEIYEVIDDSKVDGEKVKRVFEKSFHENITVKTVYGENGKTDFIKIKIPGESGKINSGKYKTLGIIGRLGGIGARPSVVGSVSDGDGAIAALAIALKLSRMQERGDVLKGDVIISTHICPDAPTMPHDPVPFMGSPIDMKTCNEQEVDKDMDAILSIDTTKGNNIVNNNGFAISPTVKEGYILKTSEDLLDIMMTTTGKAPFVLPITTQDITPYGNGLSHINSIMQPATHTDKPVVGIAITTETAVAGCATGASHFTDIENSARFALEVAKRFTSNGCSFYDEEEFDTLIDLYGEMNHLQTLGKMIK
ncbi:MAG: DUF1177 domain-containing protein [Tissierellia bacterium]|nr:DUF1177 domain-containing protein [Tissierellia bacterium]